MPHRVTEMLVGSCRGGREARAGREVVLVALSSCRAQVLACLPQDHLLPSSASCCVLW